MAMSVAVAKPQPQPQLKSKVNTDPNPEPEPEPKPDLKKSKPACDPLVSEYEDGVPREAAARRTSLDMK